ncbi:MFS transporter [Actinomadura rupiterrae]|uniref:MFS transporter n=1 Tax=Actinomadura rupiterrae TaxID=559627 RepID=UPI0020A449C2|nr:MFS transporter [Actinomadura rupiterrae]MCP2336677.1 MFS family permease [Actinomadura rupiterrae]
MYLSTIGLRRVGPRAGAAVGPTVLALGAVSLVTDVSSEMVTAVLPLYLVLTLQMGPVVYGVMDGMYTGATALLRVAGGYVADRTRRRKGVAGAGYGVSAVAKLGLVAAGASVPAIGAVIVADRLGKGLRTAPRDAMITAATPEARLGRAFGVHRAMDSAGAFAGPLVALGLLTLMGAATARTFDALFTTSFCIACAGVLLLFLTVREKPAEASASPPSRAAVSGRAAVGLLRLPAVRRLTCAAFLLGLSTVGDGFVYLILMRGQGVTAAWFPILAVGTNLAYLVLAAPFGMLADRIGRLPVVLGGYAALFVVYLLLSNPLGGTGWTVLALVLYGGYYAATDGVLMALTGPAVPEAMRTTGLALVQSGQALAYLLSSVGFGAAWSVWGASTAMQGAAVVVVVAVTATALLLSGNRTRPEAEVR